MAARRRPFARARRQALGRLAGALGLLSPLAHARAAGVPPTQYPAVTPGRTLEFPRDHGAHPLFRTEWWYLTGWLDAGIGLQITFFRSRPGIGESAASPFAPRQLLFAHAAIADRAIGHLLHDQRAARAGLGLAHVAEHTTDVAIGDWHLTLDGTDRYRARIAAREFDLTLEGVANTPILLQGAAGYSRKGPQPQQASYYYSRPRVALSGRLAHRGGEQTVRGSAWLDHEWSSELMDSQAQGWDWLGVTLDDGSDVMAFRMRGADGGSRWAGGTLRTAARVQVLEPKEVQFEPLRWWRSPRTGARYPVAIRIRAGALEITLEPLMDDQELDARASVGTVYWEGAVIASRGGTRVGRGYLELTGYFRRLAI